jgi:hypothetical protein
MPLRETAFDVDRRDNDTRQTLEGGPPLPHIHWRSGAGAARLEKVEGYHSSYSLCYGQEAIYIYT